MLFTPVTRQLSSGRSLENSLTKLPENRVNKLESRPTGIGECEQSVEPIGDTALFGNQIAICHVSFSVASAVRWSPTMAWLAALPALLTSPNSIATSRGRIPWS